MNRKRMISVLAMMSMIAVTTIGCSSTPKASQASSDTAGQATASDVNWPKKAIQIICPFAPGGDTDFNARTYAKYLSDELGESVVIVSTDGNGGAVGARKAKDSANDGYSVLFSSSAFLTNELSGAIDFGLDAFEFSCIAAGSPGNVVCVNKNMGVTNMKELMEYSQAHPGLKLTANTGATTHAIALMLIEAGLNANIVDSGGSGDRIAGLLGGHVDVIVNSYGSVKDYIDSGDFIALGLDSINPPKLITGIPTITEQGYDVAFPGYYFFAFPEGTDPAIVEKFTKAVEKIALTNEDYAQDIKTAYFQTPVFYGGQEGLDKFAEARQLIERFEKQLKGN